MAMPNTDRNTQDSSQQGSEYKDQVIYVGRVTKVVKGGKNFSFSALVVVGDGKHHGAVGGLVEVVGTDRGVTVAGAPGHDARGQERRRREGRD